MTKIIKTTFGSVPIGATVVINHEVFTKVRETIAKTLNGTERFVSPSDVVRARRILH